ncbi:hypothetical protein NQ314_018529 [Rhamnusium bicolor]|uniref:Uncharacterized protein n=1 Tax=Rhamnusium bicolor TaxID=1586634 RepID=A0AAV8WQP9_9CUCU|nr:hypothetical protein NQ314_018529 [Rhamnusium bicolor]
MCVWPQQCLIWGVSFPDIKLNNGLNICGRKDIVCVSSNENDKIKQKLREKGFNVIEVCGAGYKTLTVILGKKQKKYLRTTSKKQVTSQISSFPIN